MKDTQPVRVRFGAYELDLKAGELRTPADRGCEGDRQFVLQEQPFRVLLMLLERGGEIVTREEIQKKLWPNDTIVEFDHSINAAIRKLRRALGDSAEEPQYVETVARRGYRLLMPVEWIAAAQDSPGEVGAPPFRLLLAKEWEPAGAGVAAAAPPDPGALTGRT